MITTTIATYSQFARTQFVCAMDVRVGLVTVGVAIRVSAVVVDADLTVPHPVWSAVVLSEG
jgi:hypothetical protein